LALFLKQLAESAPGRSVIRLQLSRAPVKLFGVGVVCFLRLLPRRSGGQTPLLLL